MKFRSYRGLFFLILAVMLGVGGIVWSHCQIPCGIYDDQLRFDMMREHLRTIEKSIDQINALSKEYEKNHNQIVRWVMNKDQHADEFSEIVTYYFLAQRVEPVKRTSGQEYVKYLEKLTLLHRMIFLSMKCKQGTDIIYVDDLKTIVDEFEKVYFQAVGVKQS